MINNQNIVKVEVIKYLGLYLDYTGINYFKDLKAKYNKAKFAVSSIKWTKYHHMFRDSYKQFYKTCVMPILGYGVELYNTANINKFKLLRVDLIKRLHSGKYRFPDLQNNYLSMPLYREMKILSLNVQLNALDVPLMHSEFDNKDDIFAANRTRIEDQWNTQPRSFRASHFKSKCTLTYLASKVKLPGHLKRLLVDFITGFLPRKRTANHTPVCLKCNQVFANLNHFEESCLEDEYTTRESIYSQLQSNHAATIFATLKMLKETVRMALNPQQVDQ